MNPKHIRDVQIYNSNNTMIMSFDKNYSFPAKRIGDKIIDDIISFKGKKLPIFDESDQLSVIINMKSGERIKYFCTTAFSSLRVLELRLNAAQARTLEDKRRFYKIKIEINCRINSAMRGEETVIFPQALYGKIKDINIGGVFVSVDDNVYFEKNDIITVHAVLGHEVLEISATILRVKKNEHGEISGYGCSFTEISRHQEEMISSYINKIQFKERQIQRDKELLTKDI
ncbi:MAG: PilZ domain-containing protein [Oscillospiraceae bacterium]|nr:PilZ domain-containing protein [Oscillospiraceae bacterium]